MPCTFVRLTGCPLRCVWCDTEYAFHGGERMSLEEIVAQVLERGCALVELTGGEPLVHPSAFELTRLMLDAGLTVLVETSGAVDVSRWIRERTRSWISSARARVETDKNLWSNLQHLTERDEVKFVVKDRADYEWSTSVIAERGLGERVRDGSLNALLMSPVWGEAKLEDLADWILEDNLPVRFQMQLHKLIWGPDATGV